MTYNGTFAVKNVIVCPKNADGNLNFGRILRKGLLFRNINYTEGNYGKLSLEPHRFLADWARLFKASLA